MGTQSTWGFWKDIRNMRGLSLACYVLCAGLVFSQETTESSTQEEITAAPTAAPTAPSTEAPVVIIKQVNEINEDGTYTVGYEASDGSFKLETKDIEGNVEGKYGFIDETGEIKIVEYSANNSTGFTSDSGVPAVDLSAAVSGEAAPAAAVSPAFALEQQRHAAVIAHQKSVVERQQQIARQRDDSAQRQAFANQRGGQSQRRPVFNAANFNPSRPASEQFNTQNFNQDFQQFQQGQQQPQQQFAQQPQQQFAQQPQ